MLKWCETIAVLLVTAVLSAHAAIAEPVKEVIHSPTTAWNHTWDEVLWDLWIIGGVFAVGAVYLLIRYRAKSPGAVGTARPLSLDMALAWALIPAAIFMADDFLLAAKGWTLWNIQRQVPPNATEVKVTGGQWYFEFDYGDGVKASELVVPVGQPVVLRMTSNDVIHSFGLTDYRLKEDLMPGRITYLWFYPDKPLNTLVTCVEFCGNSHAEMNSPVRALAKADYDAWFAGKQQKVLERKRRLEMKNKKQDSDAAPPAAR